VCVWLASTILRVAFRSHSRRRNQSIVHTALCQTPRSTNSVVPRRHEKSRRWPRCTSPLFLYAFATAIRTKKCLPRNSNFPLARGFQFFLWASLPRMTSCYELAEPNRQPGSPTPKECSSETTTAEMLAEVRRESAVLDSFSRDAVDSTGECGAATSPTRRLTIARTNNLDLST